MFQAAIFTGEFVFHVACKNQKFMKLHVKSVKINKIFTRFPKKIKYFLLFIVQIHRHA